MEPRPGEKFGPYRLVKWLGRGGMGVVWRAVDADPSYSGPDVALKILQAEADEQGVGIRREIEAVKRLKHECICCLLDFGTWQGTPYLAFECLGGEDLSDLLRREGRLTPEAAWPILRDVLAGLQHAHDRRVYHRDLKPANIRILPSGRAKLMDYGIAKVRSVTRGITMELDQLGDARIGTPQYMAPEQWEKEGEQFGKIDHRADLYELGIVMFEMLTGEMPFGGGGWQVLMSLHCFSDPPSLLEADATLPPELDQVVQRLLKKHPDARFQQASEVLEALQPLFEAPPVPPQTYAVGPPSGAYPAYAPPSSRHPAPGIYSGPPVGQPGPRSQVDVELPPAPPAPPTRHVAPPVEPQPVQTRPR